jgi:hypothetical protein
MRGERELRLHLAAILTDLASLAGHAAAWTGRQQDARDLPGLEVALVWLLGSTEDALAHVRRMQISAGRDEAAADLEMLRRAA